MLRRPITPVSGSGRANNDIHHVSQLPGQRLLAFATRKVPSTQLFLRASRADGRQLDPVSLRFKEKLSYKKRD
jgi:hypothetical protein